MNVYAKYNKNAMKTQHLLSKYYWFKSKSSMITLISQSYQEDIPKPSGEWNELEKRKSCLNSKVVNALFFALDKKEFHRVSNCESAYEIWNKLEVVYKGTNQVKESKINRCTRQHELSQMEQNESVYFMYTRFTGIVNTLGALGKTFRIARKLRKLFGHLKKNRDLRWLLLRKPKI